MTAFQVFVVQKNVLFTALSLVRQHTNRYVPTQEVATNEVLDTNLDGVVWQVGTDVAYVGRRAYAGHTPNKSHRNALEYFRYYIV